MQVFRAKCCHGLIDFTGLEVPEKPANTQKKTTILIPSAYTAKSKIMRAVTGTHYIYIYLTSISIYSLIHIYIFTHLVYDLYLCIYIYICTHLYVQILIIKTSEILILLNSCISMCLPVKIRIDVGYLLSPPHVYFHSSGSSAVGLVGLPGSSASGDCGSSRLAVHLSTWGKWKRIQGWKARSTYCIQTWIFDDFDCSKMF